MMSSVSRSSESKFRLKDAEGDPLKQLELLETLNHQTAMGVLSLYHSRELWESFGINMLNTLDYEDISRTSPQTRKGR